MSIFHAKKWIFWAERTVDAVLPPRCLVTGDIVARQGTLSPEAWQSLKFIGKPCCHRCGYPFEFDAGDGLSCGACMADPPPFQHALSVLVYDDASRDLILKFKHGDHLQAAATFLPMMLRAGRDISDRADILIPVPLHRWRLLKRRYNQAAILSSGLARMAGKRNIPDGLLRVRATQPQGHMRAKGREENVKQAFAVNERHAQAIKGSRVMLVDDVYTTGATLRECTRTLLRAGAIEVSALTVARVVKAGMQ